MARQFRLILILHMQWSQEDEAQLLDACVTTVDYRLIHPTKILLLPKSNPLFANPFFPLNHVDKIAN